MAPGSSNTRPLNYVKKTTLVSSETHLHLLHRSAPRFRSCSTISTLLLTAAALLGPGGSGFGEAMAYSFDPNAGDEQQVRSFGVFRIEVLAKFRPMLQGTGLGYSLYWGYNANGTITSPLLQDKIGTVSCPPSGSLQVIQQNF